MRVARLGLRQREDWDALVAADPASGFMQSWAWSEFKTLEGYRAERLGLFAGDRLVGGAIGYAFASPTGTDLVAVPDGPVLPWDSPDAPAMFAALTDGLRRVPSARRAVALRVEPRLAACPPTLRDLPRAPVDLVPDETLLVELGPDDAMLGRMRPKGRYNVRLAARHGVEVVSSRDPGDVHEFAFILDQTARFQDFRAEPKRFFINLLQALGPDRARLAFARYKGITLAAALTVRHAETVTYLYGGHLPLFPQVMASYALHWHLLQEAAREGYRTYDFYGFVPAGRPEHPYDRFSRFKEKFGGRPVRRIGSRDVIFHDRLAAAARGVMRDLAAARR
jgi:lipid II:glycine glycyltransferase (peptidoglycan interpeptide bridge formation enzyme)